LHWVVVLLYVLFTIAIALTVPWTEQHLPRLSQVTREETLVRSEAPNSNNAVILGLWNHGPTALVGFVNGAIIFVVVGVANSSLYFASRILYGLAYNLRGTNPISRRLAGAGKLTSWGSVPAMAVLLTTVSFYWLPWLGITRNADEVIMVIGITSSISCLIVWATLCVAFIRFEIWLVIRPFTTSGKLLTFDLG
jgi:amino acid transporter